MTPLKQRWFLQSLLTREAKPFLATVALYLAIAALYLWVVPPLEGFDSISHTNYINYLRKFHRLPVINAETVEFSYEAAVQPPLYYLVAAVANAFVPYNDADATIRASENRYFPTSSQRWSLSLPNVPPSHHTSLWIARLISLLGGLITLWCAWYWARLAQPTSALLASAVALMATLNPLFLFSATTITNDVWAAAGTASVIVLVYDAASTGKYHPTRWFAIGCVSGLAILTKYSVFLAAPLCLIILFLYRHQIPLATNGKSNWRTLARALSALSIGGLLIAGYWYGRNLFLYGELIPLNTLGTTISTLMRPGPMPWDEVIDMLPWLFYSFWGLFVAVYAPASYLEFVWWFTVIGVAGFVVGRLLALIQWRPKAASASPDMTRSGIVDQRMTLLALLWFGINLISMLNYMRAISYGEQARFLLTASPAIGFLLVVGWQSWLPHFVPVYVRNQFYRLLIVISILIALWPLPTLYTNYQRPNDTLHGLWDKAQMLLGSDSATAIVPGQPMVELNATFAQGITLIGFDLPQGHTILPNEPLPLAIHWQAKEVIEQDLTLFLHLTDAQNRLYYQFDGVPYRGRHPTRQWVPGEVFVDPYLLIPSTPVDEETLATLTVGFYEFQSPESRVAVFDGQGEQIGDRVALAQLRLLAASPLEATETIVADGDLLALWNNGIRLVAATIDEGTKQEQAANEHQRHYHLELIWQTDQLLWTDYTVFIQFLNADQEIVGQVDSQPQAGQLPTATWLPGELIEDQYEIPVTGAWEQIIVGFYRYDGERYQRLLLTHPQEQQDFYQLR